MQEQEQLVGRQGLKEKLPGGKGSRQVPSDCWVTLGWDSMCFRCVGKCTKHTLI